jgi:hypothetical protein
MSTSPVSAFCAVLKSISGPFGKKRMRQTDILTGGTNFSSESLSETLHRIHSVYRSRSYEITKKEINSKT